MGTVGAITVGAAKEPANGLGIFDPLVEAVKDALPRGSSARILVAENRTAEKLVSAVGAKGRQVLWEDLTNEQADQLTQAAVRE